MVWKGRLRPGPLRVLLVAGLVSFLAGTVRAQDLETAVRESYPTNLTMLTEATRSAVSEMFLGFHQDPGATILVEPGGKHEANWFVENQILAYLSQAGFRAYLRPGPMPGGEADTAGSPGGPMGGEAMPDSGASAPPPAAAPASGEPGGAPEADLVLRYRVVDFEITYPDNYRKSPLGSRHVQRRASVSILGQLLQGEREDVIWVGNGDVERLDVVPASKLPLLEGTNFPFTQPQLETRKIGSLVEPALVTGIVAGLIYLFYTNQN